MCYETTARPPLPPIAGGAGATTRELELKSADGTRLDAFSATTDAADAPGMVILPDVRGLHGFYKDLAVRFAEAGIHAAAFDYFEDMDAAGTAEAQGTQKLKLESEAVKGRNAWVLWAAGNQAFWDWLARHGPALDVGRAAAGEPGRRS